MTPKRLEGKMTSISFHMYITDHIMEKTVYSNNKYHTWSTYK